MRSNRGSHHAPRVSKLAILFSVVAVAAGLVGFAIVTTSATQVARAATSAADPSTAPGGDPNPDCTLIVPPNPLSAKGLATPYRLTATNPANGPCAEANDSQSAFVEATIVDRNTGAVSVYRPLVVDRGSRPAAPEIVPKLPAHAVIGIWFGFNGDNLTLRSRSGSLTSGNCVNGTRHSIFGQFAFCNATEFFRVANQAVRRGQIEVPARTTAKDGQPCMTTRDYGLVDQDQSDNVITSYLVLRNGDVAQDNATDKDALPDATTLVNGSDNLLLDGFVDPALGCPTFDAPDLTDPGHEVSSLALDELFAAARQSAPVALVPEIDPMTLAGDRVSAAKTNLYRAGVDMGPFNRRTESAGTYCRDTLRLGERRIQQDRTYFESAPSPDPGAASNLYTFLAQRWDATLANLNCAGIIAMPRHPVRLTTDDNGVVTDATFPHHRR